MNGGEGDYLYFAAGAGGLIGAAIAVYSLYQLVGKIRIQHYVSASVYLLRFLLAVLVAFALLGLVI